MQNLNTHGEIIYHDEFGKEYILDEKGNRRPPMKTSNCSKSVSGFRTYDSSQGHCALCGRLDCNSSCFK